METVEISLEEEMAAARLRLGTIEYGRRMQELRETWAREEAAALEAKKAARIEANRRLIVSRYQTVKDLIGALEELEKLACAFEQAGARLDALNITPASGVMLHSDIPARIRAIDTQALLEQAKAANAALTAELCK